MSRYIMYLYTGHCKKLQAVLKADSQAGLQDLLDTAEFMRARLCKDQRITVVDVVKKQVIAKIEREF